MYGLVSTKELPGGNRVCIHCHSIALSVIIPLKETGFDRVVDLCDCGAGGNFETLLKSDTVLYRQIETIHKAIATMIKKECAAAPLNACNITNAELSSYICETFQHIRTTGESKLKERLGTHLEKLLTEREARLTK